MDFASLLKAVLVVLVGAFLKWLFITINVEIDEVLFNTIVVGLVAWFLTLFGYSGTATIINKSTKREVLPLE